MHLLPNVFIILWVVGLVEHVNNMYSLTHFRFYKYIAQTEILKRELACRLRLPIYHTLWLRWFEWGIPHSFRHLSDCSQLVMGRLGGVDLLEKNLTVGWLERLRTRSIASLLLFSLYLCPQDHASLRSPAFSAVPASTGSLSSPLQSYSFLPAPPTSFPSMSSSYPGT